MTMVFLSFMLYFPEIEDEIVAFVYDVIQTACVGNKSSPDLKRLFHCTINSEIYVLTTLAKYALGKV